MFFLTGSDEHGQKIANTAASLGVQPIEICNKYAGEQVWIWSQSTGRKGERCRCSSPGMSLVQKLEQGCSFTVDLGFMHKLFTSCCTHGCVEWSSVTSANFQALNKRLLISNDAYIRTTMEYHKETSRKLWGICAEKGDIYLGKYEVSFGISERLTRLGAWSS